MQVNTPGQYKTVEGALVEVVAVTARYAIGYRVSNPDDDNVWDRNGNALAPKFSASVGMGQIVKFVHAHESREQELLTAAKNMLDRIDTVRGPLVEDDVKQLRQAVASYSNSDK